MENRIKPKITVAFLALFLLLAGCKMIENKGENTSSDSQASIVSEASKSEPSQNKTEDDPLRESKEPSEDKPPKDEDLVLIKDYIPDAVFDIRYATENNFTGKKIYDSSDAYLRYGTVKKLIAVQDDLKKQGYRLLIWDAFRPTEAQRKLWEAFPDPNFVSDPSKGFSGHCRGNTVDITIVRSDRSEVEMPSGFDEFGALADRDYSDVSANAAENARLLEQIMIKNGFTGYSKEWWHFSDTVKYDVVT